MNIRIKICGLKTMEDILAVDRLGGDAIGLNFYPKSPRYLEPRSSIEIIKAIPPLLNIVGLWVDTPFRQIAAISYQLGIRTVQWYGENPDFEQAFPFSIIPAFRIKDRLDLNKIDSILEKCKEQNNLPGAILLDSQVEGAIGGTGKTAPWEILADYRPGVPRILAGGLNPTNVAEAIRIVQPEGVDVASGVETLPGKKDHELMKRFIEEAREAASKHK